MNRKEFAQKLIALGACPLAFLTPDNLYAEENIKLTSDDEEFKKLKYEKEFVENWLSDLLDSMSKTIDRETQVKIVEGCGRSCFNRWQFKKDIAEAGKGNLEKLMDAYKSNFEIWIEGNNVHIRFGETSDICYCPAARYRTATENDIHCECTKATHQAIFEAALGKKFDVDILETVRRGGRTCHFLVHLS